MMVALAPHQTPARLQSIMHHEYVPNWRLCPLVSVSLFAEGSMSDLPESFEEIYISVGLPA
jgi:hypothetical protein